jgi:hypothetical protein
MIPFTASKRFASKRFADKRKTQNSNAAIEQKVS